MKTIIIGPNVKKIFDKITSEKDRKMTSLKDVLKMALASKNKQAHRIAGGTKAGRRLQASHSEKYTITKGQSDERIRELERESEGTHSKTDI